MIYINHNKKAIFIHIPKTGGSYIGPSLVKYYGFTNYLPLLQKRRPDHNIICQTMRFKRVITNNPLYDNSFFNKTIGLLTYCKTSAYLNKQMNMDDNKWNTYTKFCFIRNPYSRALSGWKHVNTILKLNTGFNQYLNQPKYNVADIEYGHIFMSQTAQIQDINGECGVDIIGKFETLEEDFRIILIKIGFNEIIHKQIKVNVSNKDNNENIVFEKQTVIKINELFNEDFNNFHYIKF